MKVTKKIHSVLPVYLVAVTWIVGTVFLSVHTLTGLIRLALVSLLVFLVASAVFPGKVIEVEQPAPKPKEEEKPKDPELAALEEERKRAVSELERLNASISDPDISRRLAHIQSTTEKIFAFVKEHPEKKSQIRRFQDYYLPTTIKLLNAYDRMDDLGVSGENINASKERVEQMLTTVETAYDKQLDALFQDEAMDISADATVLEQMMAQEGLTGNGQAMP